MASKTTTVKAKKTKTYVPISPGHRACAGCGQMIAAKAVAEALGPDTIITNATGCLEVTTTPYPESAWGMPWIHSLFENSAAIASGVQAALVAKKKNKTFGTETMNGVTKKIAKGTKVVAQGGDGSSFDIGFGLISGMWERGEDILYVCYDNEAYANTGRQASGATPWGASTTTTPAGSGPTIDAIGSHQRKKDMISIALAHGLNFVAQTTAGYIDDIKQKVAKAIATPGPSYIQILVPCIPGWSSDMSQSVTLGKLAAQTGLYPVLEFENGVLTKAMKVPAQTPSVEEYMKLQGRFKHLFKSPMGKEQIKVLQQRANDNILKYGLK